jgi:hypothetical protein
MSWFDWVGAISGGAGVVTGTAGLWIGAKANRTANGVARIEGSRWHAEMTPVFQITLKESGDRASLDVKLTGPTHLGGLDAVHLTITPSDDMDRTPRLAGLRYTQAEVDAQVWGRTALRRALMARIRPGAQWPRSPCKSAGGAR